MKYLKFKSHLWMRRTPAEIFPFFTEARNLEKLTPPALHFVVHTPPPITMRVGTLIDYGLRIHGFPFRWRSEITEWEPPHRFVDRQRRGPFRFWSHEHRFEAWDGGTLVKDIVTYSVLGGRLIDRLFVRADIKRIFTHREKILRETFGGAMTLPTTPPPETSEA